MVRFATEKDLAFLKNAWEVCFQDPKQFIDWNFSENFSFSDTLIAEAEGVPASNMQLMPHRIRLRNRDYFVNYVSGVATLPEYRKRGLVRELFHFGFSEMEQRNQPISLLVPFDYPFYEKFGYKQCYDKTFRYSEHLPKEAMTPEVTEQLIDDMDRIYQTAMRGKTGYALRTKSDWNKILTDIFVNSKGKVVFQGRDGYALLSPKTEGEGWEIHEMLGSCNIPCQEETKPFAMARILDVKGLLRDLAEEFDGRIGLKIQDDMIAKNNGVFLVERGKVTLGRDYDAELDIKELAQAIFGFGKDPTGTGLFSSKDTYLNLIF